MNWEMFLCATTIVKALESTILERFFVYHNYC
jgi:hypothetical protein